LNDFVGEKGIFIVFTTTWCRHCITVIPDLKNIYADIQTRNIEMLAVYIREPRDKVKAFSEKHALPYPVLLDLDGAVASLYKIRGVPSFVLIDKAGSIKYMGHSIPATIIKEIGK
jgi:peroxiredoxin